MKATNNIGENFKADNQTSDLREIIKYDKADFEILQVKAREYVKLMAYYNCAIMEIQTKLKVLNEESSLQHDRTPITSIQTRLKRPVSIKEKLERKGFPVSVESIEENIYDIAGVRAICSFINDVYLIEKALLAQDDVFLIQRKDYIQNPKENGYRSLHLIVETPIFLASEKKMMKVEIQLRTIAMDSWATLEHQINYKKDVDASNAGLHDELFRCAELSAELDERMENLRRCFITDP